MTKKDFLLAKNTGLRASLLVDRVPGVSLFGPMFNKDNVMFYFTQGTLHGPYAEAIKPKYTWANREKGRLWWTTMAQTLRTKKAMRINCARRLRHAFVTSLKDHGYDRDGFSLLGKQHRGLVGTLEMHSFKPLLSAKFNDLKAETDRLVKWVEEQQSSRDQHSNSHRIPAPHQLQSTPVRGKATVEQVTTKRPAIRANTVSARKVIFSRAAAPSTQASMLELPPATRSRPSQRPATRTGQKTSSQPAQPTSSDNPRKPKAGVKSVSRAVRPHSNLVDNMSQPGTTVQRTRNRKSSSRTFPSSNQAHQ